MHSGIFFFLIVYFKDFIDQGTALEVKKIFSSLKKVKWRITWRHTWIQISKPICYGKYSCNQCYYQSIRKHNLISHVEIYHEGMGHQCPKCQFKANRKQYLQWHMKSTHDDVKYDCIKCEFKSTRKEKVKSHIRTTLKSDVISPARDSSEAPRSSSQYRVSQSVLCYLLPATVQRHRQCY